MTSPMTKPIPLVLPEIDLVANAKTTRKTFERLASFSHLTCNEDSPLLAKTLAKIHGLVKLVDTSMVAAHLGYRLATSAMILCDSEEQEWEADVSLENLKELVAQGVSMSNEVVVGFRDVQQEIYKIAASTKDSNLLVVVPPDATHADEIKMQLKGVGTGLVANMKLLSDFSRIANETAEWWSAIDNELQTHAPQLLPVPEAPNATDAPSPEDAEKFAEWSKMKDSYQDYYNQVNVIHVSFPELLGPSITAWKAVATAQSLPSSEANSLVDLGEHFQKEEPSLKKGKRKTISRFFSSKPRGKEDVQSKKRKNQEIEHPECSCSCHGIKPTS
ncbi:hypothetical protein CPB83DRAFT_849642 [Crepidotus variabilis]|uniref:Uncharacterized protein n=1 Tax=Crepidotus variabilis TaxID=179855 RepID=A0A9P6ELS5_9AGAR|nr:hypothetical protein CPB83DRAFT_849642 [Crepidotus variabilis]